MLHSSLRPHLFHLAPRTVILCSRFTYQTVMDSMKICLRYQLQVLDFLYCIKTLSSTN